MIYYTKYAEQKFDILNKYKVYFTREQVEDVLKTPEKVEKKGKYIGARKDEIKVIFRKENGTKRIITFFPIKN